MRRPARHDGADGGGRPGDSPVAPNPLPGDAAVDAGLLRAAKHPVARAARLLGICESKVRQAIREGRLPALLIDGRYLLLERDMEAFLRARYGVTRKAARRERPAGHRVPKWVDDSDLLKTGRTA